MSKFKEDDGVRFTNIRDNMSDWLAGRVVVIQRVVGIFSCRNGEPFETYYVIDAIGNELVAHEDELTAYP